MAVDGETRPDRGAGAPARRPEPGGIIWAVALAGVVLPWIGAPLSLAGLALLLRSEPGGWPLLATGAALIAADIVIDVYLAHPSVAATDEPALNRRGQELVGRRITLDAPIVAGRGRARIADSVWTLEGPDLAVGVEVRVTSIRGTVLEVEPFAATRR